MELSFPILFQDESLVAISKPGGILIHRSQEAKDQIVVLQQLAQQLEKYLYPIHRIDRAASGVVIFALTKEDAKTLQQTWQKETTRKEYLAMARGKTPEHWIVDKPLKNQAGTPQEAKTEFWKLAEMAEHSLVKARIYTGKRHQIRRHLAHCAHQILGDTTHGKGKINRFLREKYGLPRMFLHAHLLEIEHPRTGELLSLQAPLAEDLQTFLERLPGYESGLLERLRKGSI